MGGTWHIDVKQCADGIGGKNTLRFSARESMVETGRSFVKT